MSTDQSRIEYAVRLTWPDGHSEVQPETCRASAEATVRRYNRAYSDSAATAELMCRTPADWQVAS